MWIDDQENTVLYEEQIERDASALLAEFSAARGVVVAPPIPIEDIIEKHLKLLVEFDDTHRLFGVPRSGPGLDPDILGAIYFDERRIVIDESLDPEENPSKEGRYRYTLDHRFLESAPIGGIPLRRGDSHMLLL